MNNPVHQPRKSLGQHFLKNPEVLDRIVEEAELVPGDWVLEIGPGTGNLTRRIAGVTEKWWALEKDSELCTLLTHDFSKPIIEADARFFDYRTLPLPSGNKLKLLANLPYNVANEILLHLISYRDLFSVMVCMLQEEVADRLIAHPGTKAYGVLSVTIQLYFSVEKLFRVPPAVFFPPPKVNSALVRLQPRKRRDLNIPDENLFFRLVKTAFSQRRKTLVNALKGFCGHPRQEIVSSLHACDIDPSRRGETLTIEEFAQLARCF